MKSTPLLLKGPLVRRSLDGRKIMTRRLVTSLSGIGPVTEFQPSKDLGYQWTFRDKRALWNDMRQSEVLDMCPYGTVGDELWGRETFAEVGTCDPLFLTYRATYPDVYGGPTRDTRTKLLHGLENIPPASDVKWRPAIFMPREACRLVMGITEVRLEQLQDITDADIQAEGVGDLTLDELIEMGVSGAYIRSAFKNLPYFFPNANLGGGWDSLPLRPRWYLVWNAINGHRNGASWDANPYVWVIKYQRLDGNTMVVERQNDSAMG